MPLTLPDSDDVLERHQFYAATSAQIDNLKLANQHQSDSIHRVHERLDKVAENFITTKEVLTNTETRNRTIAASVVVAWTLISGVFGWMWDKSSSKVDQFITKIEQQEKIIAELSRERETIKTELAQSASSRRILVTMQQDIEEIQRRLAEKDKK
jgi:cell division protein FtsB